MIELLGRAGWTVAEGYEPRNVSVCRRCTHQVLWCWHRGRYVPMNRDGSRHPFECRVDIRSVRPHEMGTNPLRRCPYCSKSITKYSMSDLGIHVRAKHPIARTLPRGY